MLGAFIVPMRPASRRHPACAVCGRHTFRLFCARCQRVTPALRTRRTVVAA